MYGYNNVPPPWVWPGMVPPTPTSQDPVEMIEGWIKGLEAVKRLSKEEKKDDKKKSAELPSVGLMLFMLLIAPVTGPLMYSFFQWGNHILAGAK